MEQEDQPPSELAQVIAALTGLTVSLQNDAQTASAERASLHQRLGQIEGERAVENKFTPETLVQIVQAVEARAASSGQGGGGNGKFVKPPSPGMFDGKSKGRSVQWWTFHAEAYLQAMGLLNSVEGVAHISRYFDEGVLKWWRVELARDQKRQFPLYDNWISVREALIVKFTNRNHRQNMRDKLKNCIQRKSVRAYNEEYNEIIIEFPDRSDEDIMDDYLEGLQGYIRAFVKTKSPADLIDAQTFAEEVDRCQNPERYRYSEDRSDRGNRPRTYASITGAVPMEINRVGVRRTSPDDRFGDKGFYVGPRKKTKGSKPRFAPKPKSGRRNGDNAKKSYRNSSLSMAEKSKLMQEGKCFNCRQTGHLASECPKGRRQGN